MTVTTALYCYATEDSLRFFVCQRTVRYAPSGDWVLASNTRPTMCPSLGLKGFPSSGFAPPPWNRCHFRVESLCAYKSSPSIRLLYHNTRTVSFNLWGPLLHKRYRSSIVLTRSIVLIIVFGAISLISAISLSLSSSHLLHSKNVCVASFFGELPYRDTGFPVIPILWS